MAAPAADMPRRAVSTQRAVERHTQGTQSPAITRAHTRPRTASGTPAISDHELVVTRVQFTIPVSGHASAAGSA